MAATPDIGVRVYEAALRLYPPAFRREFGVEMVRDVREANLESEASRGWRDAAAFWLAIAGDVLMTVPLEWCRTGLPLLALVSALPGAAFLGVLARVERRAWVVVVPEQVADREVLALVLLVTVVLFLILATIMFTLWFARPRVSRRR
jgi:hypothetical protein